MTFLDMFNPAVEAAGQAYASQQTAPIQAELETAKADLTVANDTIAVLGSDLNEAQQTISDQAATIGVVTAERDKVAAQLAICEASKPSPSRPTWGKADGRRITIATQADLNQLIGKKILCPIDIRVPGIARLSDFEIDITTGVAITANTYSISVDGRYTAGLELTDGLVSASTPSKYVFGLVGAGIVTRRMEIRNVVDGINTTGDWTDYGSWIHDLVQTKPVHADDAAAGVGTKAWRLYGTVLDAGVYAGADSLACIMWSPGWPTSFQAFGAFFLGGYPQMNVTKNSIVPPDFLMQDCRFGPTAYPGGAVIIANTSKWEAIRGDGTTKGLVRTTMLDGSPVVIAKGA